jgi:hypothetical protein
MVEPSTPEDKVSLEKLDALLEEYNNEKKLITEPELLFDFNFDSVQINYTDVASILELNCTPCHKPNGNGPFSLKNYYNVKKRSSVIREVIQKKIMPPWFADDHYSTFYNAPQLSDSTRALIIEWIDRGCPNSSEEKLVTDGSEIKQSALPDTILTRKSHMITSNEDSYHCFVYETGFEEDRYVSGIEFLSDNPAVIHHLTLFLDTSQVAKYNQVSWDCKKSDFVEFKEFTPLLSWSGGMRPFKFNPKLAYKIPKGSRFVLQAHYSDENHKGKKEKTVLKLFFTEESTASVEFNVLNKFDIMYPANEIVTESVTYQTKDSISLLGLIPHMHFLTKKVECYAITPDKEVIQLLKIPKWDYLWQGQFIYEFPLIIPKGSIIYCNVIIDNTKENPTQPNSPVRDVFYNKGANDEMLVLVLLNKKFAEGDQFIKIAEFLN